VASWPGSLGWLLVPLRSTTSDAVRIVRSPSDPLFLLGLGLFVLSVLALRALLHSGRPVAALGLGWIWIAFLPTANLFPQIHAHAERYLFLSVFGAVLLLVDLAGAADPSRRRRALALATLAALALFWAGRTWVRTPSWRSTRTLFEADVARDPTFREGRYHLARVLFEQRRHTDADLHLRPLVASLATEPGRWSYANAGGIRELACANDVALGRSAQVAAELVALERSDPGAAHAPGLRACLAEAQEKLGRPEAALATYEELILSLAGDPPARASLAIARLHARLGHRDEARSWLERARRDGPREPVFDWELRQVEKLLR
jgi:tetratricopeptide (TPR) repeat protein